METPPAPPGATKKSTLNSLSKTSLNLTPCRRLGLGRPSTGSLKKSLHLRVVNSPLQNKTDCLPSKLDSVSTANEESALENCVEKIKGLVDCSNLLNRPTHNIGVPRVRRCLKISLKTPSPNHITSKRVSDSESTTKNIASEESQCNERLIGNSKRRRLSLKNSAVNSDDDCVSVSEETATDCDLPEASSVRNEIQTLADVTPEMITQLIATIQDKKKKLEQLKVQDVYAKKHNLTELREQTAKWKTAGQEALQYSVDLARRAGYSVTISQLMAQHGFPPHLMGYNSEDEEFD